VVGSTSNRNVAAMVSDSAILFMVLSEIEVAIANSQAKTRNGCGLALASERRLFE
jgi:hypothetical protein